MSGSLSSLNHYGIQHIKYLDYLSKNAKFDPLVGTARPPTVVFAYQIPIGTNNDENRVARILLLHIRRKAKNRKSSKRQLWKIINKGTELIAMKKVRELDIVDDSSLVCSITPITCGNRGVGASFFIMMHFKHEVLQIFQIMYILICTIDELVQMCGKPHL